MEGHAVRGRYPLTALYMLAYWRGDENTMTRVSIWSSLVAGGHLLTERLPVVERLLEKYVNGQV